MVENTVITKNEFSFNMNPKGNTCKIFIPDIQEKSIKTSTTPTEYNEIVQSESDSVDIVADNQITDTVMQPVVESKHLSQAWRTQSSKNKL